MRNTLLFGLGVFVLAGCGTQEQKSAPLSALSAPRTYIVSSATALPGDFSGFVKAQGDTLRAFKPEAGFASVTTSNPKAYRRFADVVVEDVRLERNLPKVAPVAGPSLDVGNPPNSGDDDTRFNLQWGHDAVNAPEAWNAGVRGKGVVVAVLDGGFSLNHPDIAPNVAGWADMTGEGIAYGPNPDDPTGIFSHGMHVAGTIAAVDNGLGTIGVAPEAKLLLVKVLFNVGSGSFEDVLEGIYYAADYGVDVINMSLGADIPQGSGKGSNEIAELRKAMNRAIGYAYQKGATVIVAAGNDGRDLDKDRSTTVFPAQMPHAISISATAPIGWAKAPATTFLDNLASYSNYGQSGVDFSAPGGDSSYPGNENCTLAGLTRPCWVFDLVFSTGAVVGPSAFYYWSAGTSMAAPHAAGVAALIISEKGGELHPAQVKAELAARAADLGKPGNDPVYGAGAIRSGY